METVAIILGPISAGIMLDLIFNGGDGLSNILSSLRSKSQSSKQTDKISLIEDTISKLDDLHEDLEYENSPEELATIKAKIAIRQKLLDSLLQQHV